MYKYKLWLITWRILFVKTCVYACSATAITIAAKHINVDSNVLLLYVLPSFLPHGQFEWVVGCFVIAYKIQNARHLINRRIQLKLNFCFLNIFSTFPYPRGKLNEYENWVNNSWTINGELIQLTDTLIANHVVLTVTTLTKKKSEHSKQKRLYLCPFYSHYFRPIFAVVYHFK